MSQSVQFINSFEMFSLHGHTTLHYDCCIIADFLKYRMNGIYYLCWLSLNIHNCHPCMYSCSKINNITNPCLAHLQVTLAAACCAAVVAAAQQWWQPHSCTA
jgi:hypothetical protein